MNTSVLEQLRTRPVPAKEVSVRVKVPKPDKRESVFLSIPIEDKREVEQLDRHDILKRMDSVRMVRNLVGDDTIRLKPLTQPKPVAQKRHTRTKKQPSDKDTQVPIGLRKNSNVLLEGTVSQLKITDDVELKLPKKQPKIIRKSPAYYQNNRERFIEHISKLFEPYEKQLKTEAGNLTCDNMKTGDGFSDLLTHQKIVRDYINMYTPYRGLLLYHGLGSGKTCSSIAIAEGLKDTRKIMVMTPASLEMNYFKELKKCGDPMYKKKQYWEFVNIIENPDELETLSSVLQIPKEDIVKKKGAWMVDVTKPPNYDTLTTDQAASLDDQLNMMIQMKYQFIRYNGIRMSDFEAMSNNFNINPFSNKVIIIDEAHNFVSRIVNKLKKNDSLSMVLYRYLMEADNVKIIMLTGTPIINYPNEIAVLYNILRGYIKTWKFPLTNESRQKVDETFLKKELEKHPRIKQSMDFVEYSAEVLYVTKNPFGFVNVVPRGNYQGVVLQESREISNEEFQGTIIKILQSLNISVNERVEIEGFKLLPDNPDEFNQLFLGDNHSVKNIQFLKKRILGLTSYFRSAEVLLPKYNKETDMHLIELEMSDYQFEMYEKARVEERKQEKSNRQKKTKPGSDDSKTSTYRIFSRAFCNFVFPPTIERPTPKKGEELELTKDNITNEELVDGANSSAIVNNVDGRYTLDDVQEVQKNLDTLTDKSYNERIDEALRELNTDAGNYFTKEALETYSPKFLEILNNLTKLDDSDKGSDTPYLYKGSHLVYSQFRTIEGIGILKLILDYHNYTQFKIIKNSAGEWNVNIAETDRSKPTYILYTGTETAEEKEILREVFNGNWDNIPVGIRDYVSSISTTFPKNTMGEIIRVFMITSSGAEGIDLKNVRWVHITEPYWHPVRINQVIGRALRICSHKDLPPEYQTVNVFLYLMKFSQSQLEGDLSVELLKSVGDRSKIDPAVVFTSDQTLYEICNLKLTVQEQLLRAIKESAMDCALHTSTNNDEQLVCFNYTQSTPTSFSYRPMILNKDLDQTTQMNREEKTMQLKKMKLRDREFIIDDNTKILYNYSKYKEQRQLVAIGKLVIEGKKLKIEKI